MDSAPSPPPAPDPNVVANAQSTADINTALAQGAMNRTNQVTPFGNLDYSQSGTYTLPNGTVIPTYTATTTYTPEEQAAAQSKQQFTQGLFGLGNAQVGRVSNAVAQPFTLDQFGVQPTANKDVLQNNINAVYGQATSRLDPQYATAQEQLDAQLRNQGFTPGTTGYDNAMRDFNFAKNDAYTSAMNNAITQGNAAEANQYGLESDAYQRAIQNALLQRELPLNEASALMSGSQISGPSLVSTPQTGVAPTDVTGAFGLSQSALNNAYNAKAAQASSTNNAEAGLAGTALLAAAMFA